MNLQILGLLCLLCLVFTEDCSNFDGEMRCSSGGATTNPASWDERIFQTPLKGEELYKDTYESLGKIMCYSDIKYRNSLSSAEISVKCMQHSSVGGLNYNFNNEGVQGSNTYRVDKAFTTPLSIVVSDSGDASSFITLDPADFLWNAASLTQDGVYQNGQKGAIVELFGWPYADIEAECEAIGKMGWMGVKVFPPQEQVQSFEWPQNGELNPWWFYYQPVSYKLGGRHGTRDELRQMINTCRSHGVRVYADAVVNHMSGGGNDVWKSHRNGGGSWCSYWGPKDSSAGSPYYTFNFMYQNSERTGLRPGIEFPGVPYISSDFHCMRDLNSWTDGFILNNGWLVGLTDLDTEQPKVQERIAAYFTDLVGIGFSGIRIDAAKHIMPESLAKIFKKFADNMGGNLPDDFMAYLEVIIGGERDLLMCQDNWYNFGTSFENEMRSAGLSDSDIYKIKIWSSDYPKEHPICGWWTIPSERYAIENDCHVN
jgi:alpha-amylase